MASPPTNAGAAAPSAGLALGATLAIQVYTSFAATAPAVLAPEIAQSLGVPASWIGAWVGLVYFGGMVASLLSGAYIARHGAIRVSQVCVGACALGIGGVAIVAPSALWLAALAALVMGLGYGPITPASSDVLARTTPRSRMSLVFSIKQTGVPAGTALAGAALPALALAIGWRGALGLAACLGVAVVLAAQPIRASLDVHRRVDGTAAAHAAWAAVRAILRHRELASLAAMSFVYAATQVCLTSFLVVHLTGTLGWSLVAAGFALSAATVAGVAGRLFWGAMADRTRRPHLVLGVIGIIASVCATLTAMSGAAWPAIAVIAVVALFGGTAIGWNGVMLAEVARLSPAGQAGAITGATGFITFSGVAVAPTIFTLLAALTGTTRAGFLLLALGMVVAGTAFVITGRKHRVSHESDH